MSVRSRNTRSHRQSGQSQPASSPRPSAPKQSNLSKAAGALKSFAGWVAKNQADYKKHGGDTSLEDDLRSIPIRVCRNAGNAGREEQRELRSRCRADDDEELTRYVSGRPPKRHPEEHNPHLEFVIKEAPKRRPKPKPKVKIIYVPYDPEAEVGYYGKK